MRVSEPADDFTFTALFSDFEEIYENRRNDKFDNLVKNIKLGKNSRIGENGYCPFCNKLIFKRDTDTLISRFRNRCKHCNKIVRWQ